MMTVDEALNHAQNELESAFEKWLSDECPSGDCESVHRQWDDSFAHLELVDELQPVMALTAEVRRLREENERLRKDAERYRWLIDQHWIQSEVDWRLIPTHQESTIEQLSKAIDAARGAK